MRWDNHTPRRDRHAPLQILTLTQRHLTMPRACAKYTLPCTNVCSIWLPVAQESLSVLAAEGGDESSGEHPACESHALSEALTVPLLQHIAPHVPLFGSMHSSTASDTNATKRRRLDAGLCEVCCLLLCSMRRSSEQIISDETESLIHEATLNCDSSSETKRALVATAGPHFASIEALCTRVSTHICERLAMAASGEANEKTEVYLLLHASARLLPCGWLAAEGRTLLQTALVAAWERSPLAAAYRPLLLSLLTVALRQTQHQTSHSRYDLDGIAVLDALPELPQELVGRVLKSIPKLLWMAKDTRCDICLSFSALRILPYMSHGR